MKGRPPLPIPPAPPRPLLAAHRVAEICQLSAAQIYHAHTPEMGSPGHFVYPLNAREQAYTMAGLCELLKGLQREGHEMAAKLLAAALRDMRAEIGRGTAPGQGVARAPVVKGKGLRPVGWQAAWESAHDGYDTEGAA